MPSDLLTTGQVARLCGVTPDAVLKWIKRGRVPAVRTAGGHFRIAREALEALGFPALRAAGQLGTGDRTTPDAALTHCWEYFCRNVPAAEACRGCVVYRARIERCYEVAEFGERIGHRRRFCRASCEDCSFFRACKGLAATALVVTGDEGMVGRLTTQADCRDLVLRFARSGYECSMRLDSFHPSVVVMDSGLPEVRDGRLVESMLQDDRMLGVRLAIMLRKGEKLRGPEAALVVPAPLTVEKIGRLAAAPIGATGWSGEQAS